MYIFLLVQPLVSLLIDSDTFCYLWISGYVFNLNLMHFSLKLHRFKNTAWWLTFLHLFHPSPQRLNHNRKKNLQTTKSWGEERVPPHLWREIGPSRSRTSPYFEGILLRLCRSRPSWVRRSDCGTWDPGPGRWPVLDLLLITEVSLIVPYSPLHINTQRCIQHEQTV